MRKTVGQKSSSISGCGCGGTAKASLKGTGCGCGGTTQSSLKGTGCGCGGTTQSSLKGTGCGCSETPSRKSLRGTGGACGCGGECCKKAALGSYSMGAQTRACNCPCPNCLMARQTQQTAARMPQRAHTNGHPSAYPPRARAGLFDPRAFQQAWPEPNTNPLIPYTFGREPRSMEISYLQPTPSITFDPRLYTPQWPDIAPEPSVRFPTLNVPVSEPPAQPYNVQPLSGISKGRRRAMGAISKKNEQALIFVEEELAAMSSPDTSGQYMAIKGQNPAIGAGFESSATTSIENIKVGNQPLLTPPYPAVFGFVPVAERDGKISLYGRWGGPEHVKKGKIEDYRKGFFKDIYKDSIELKSGVLRDNIEDVNFTGQSAPERRNLQSGFELTDSGTRRYTAEIGYVYPFKISYNSDEVLKLHQFYDDRYVDITSNANSFLNFIIRAYHKIISSIAIRDGLDAQQRLQRMTAIATFLSGDQYVNNLRLFANTIIERIFHDMENAVLLASLTTGNIDGRDLVMIRFMGQGLTTLDKTTTVKSLQNDFKRAVGNYVSYIQSFTNTIENVPDLFKVVLSAATADVTTQIEIAVKTRTDALNAQKLDAEKAKKEAEAAKQKADQELAAYKATVSKDKAKLQGISTSTKVGMAVGAAAGAYTAYRYASEQEELTPNERLATAAIGGLLGMLPIVNLLTIPFAGVFAGNIFKAGKSETAKRLASQAVDVAASAGRGAITKSSEMINRYRARDMQIAQDVQDAQVSTTPALIEAEPVDVAAVPTQQPRQRAKKKTASTTQAPAATSGYSTRRSR